MNNQVTLHHLLTAGGDAVFAAKDQDLGDMAGGTDFMIPADINGREALIQSQLFPKERILNP